MLNTRGNIWRAPVTLVCGNEALLQTTQSTDRFPEGPVGLHAAYPVIFFCMKSVYSNTSPWNLSGTRDRVTHACESGHSLAGRCQVSLPPWEAWLHPRRRHLRLPTVVQSFLSKSTDRFLFRANKKPRGVRKKAVPFCCACVISTMHCVCKWQRSEMCFSLFELSLTCPQSPSPRLLVSVMVLTFDHVDLPSRLTLSRMVSCFVSGHCIFVFEG